jgi:replicative DNA helicase
MDELVAKLPPHSIESEMCLLASMMLDHDVLGNVVQIVNRDSFYQPDHQILFDVILKLYELNRPIDAVIVREELIKRGQLDEIGGTAYLGQILSTVPSAVHGEHYARIVREKALLRQLIAASNESLREAYAPHESAELVIDKAEKRIFEIAEKKVTGTSASLGEVAAEVYEMLENRGTSGIMTGFIELDEMLNGLQPGQMIIVAARPAMGKAQPLDAKVLTPTGFTTLAQLRVGDPLASIDGQHSNVTGIYPQGQRQVYRITFSDGRSTECCAEHLWQVHYRSWDAPRILTTAKLMQLLTRRRYQNRLWIDSFAGHLSPPSKLESTSLSDLLPIDPWLLGFLLGDGSLHGSARGPVSKPPGERCEVCEGSGQGVTTSRIDQIRRGGTTPSGPLADEQRPRGVLRQGQMFSTDSPDILARVESAIDPSLTTVHSSNYDYRISQLHRGHLTGTQGSLPNPITSALRSLGLWERHSHSKFIPANYLTAPRHHRLRLLAGLLDADGWVESFGAIRIGTASLRLANEIVQLTRSLGGTASYYPKSTTYTHRGQKRTGLTSYVCNLQLPNPRELDLIPAKQNRLPTGDRLRRLTLSSIVPTRTTETQCISVSHPSHLYITDDYIVTHNTSFAMNIVENVASGLSNDGMIPAAVFSLEMSRQQLAQRMLCSLSGIDGHRVRKGVISNDEYVKMAQVVAQLSKVPLYVDDSSQLTILDLRAKARRLKVKHDIKLLMIDYMQLMDNPGVESRQQQISEISRGVKAVARELEIPVICLSQLNRASEGRDGHRPRMSDLRESGSIEQDADVVMLLHREDYYRMQEPDFQPDNIAEVIIAKQRNGPTGTVKLTFDNSTTRFKNLATTTTGF